MDRVGERVEDAIDCAVRSKRKGDGGVEGGVDPKPLHEQEADMGRAALRAMYCGERERERGTARQKERGQEGGERRRGGVVGRFR